MRKAVEAMPRVLVAEPDPEGGDSQGEGESADAFDDGSPRSFQLQRQDASPGSANASPASRRAVSKQGSHVSQASRQGSQPSIASHQFSRFGSMLSQPVSEFEQEVQYLGDEALQQSISLTRSYSTVSRQEGGDIRLKVIGGATAAVLKQKSGASMAGLIANAAEAMRALDTANAQCDGAKLARHLTRELDAAETGEKGNVNSSRDLARELTARSAAASSFMETVHDDGDRLMSFQSMEPPDVASLEKSEEHGAGVGRKRNEVYESTIIPI